MIKYFGGTDAKSMMKQIVFGVFFIMIYAYSLLVYQFCFNYELYINDYYTISLIIAIGVCFYLIPLTFHKDRLLRKSDMLLFPLLLLLFQANNQGNEYEIMVVSIIVLGLILQNLAIDLLVRLLAIVLLFCAYELAVSLKQFLDSSIHSGPIEFMGTFRNTGVYSIYLAVHVPLLYYFLFHYINSEITVKSNLQFSRNSVCFRTIKILIFTIYFAIAAYIGFHSKSRTTFIVMLISSLLLINKHKVLKGKIPRISKAFCWGICLTVVALNCYLLFHIKKGSTFGRIFMLEIAAKHLPDNFWLGVGLGMFSLYYPQWQAQYFRMNVMPPKEFFLNAGDTFIIFNEFLQLFLTIGCIGFFIFVCAFFWFFRLKADKNSSLLSTVKFTMIAILSSGLSYYPFHINVFLLVIALCFSVAISISRNEDRPIIFFSIFNNIKSRFFITVCLLPITSIILFCSFNIFVSMNRWRKLVISSDLSSSQRKNEANRLFENLKNDGKFLVEYGEFQSENNQDFSKAILILEYSKKYFISTESIELTAHNEIENKQYKEAIANFEWLVNYIPSLFKPRLELLLLYKKTGQINKARNMAKFILTMPIKVPSEEVERIRLNAKIIMLGL